MKKITILSLVTLSVSIISYNLYTTSSNAKNQEVVKYADARLVYNKIEIELKNKIKFIKDNIIKNNSFPNRKELVSLIESIKTIRSYGKDLSPKSKIDLKIIISNLKKKGKFQDLIKDLKIFVETSQSLIA